MPRRVHISNMAWIKKEDLSDADLFLLKKNLTVIPKEIDYGGDEETDDDDDSIKTNEPIFMFSEREDAIGIPRYYYRDEYAKETDVVTLDISEGRPLPANIKPITLHEEDQAKDIPRFLEKFKDLPWGGGIFSAYTAYGKSVCGIEKIIRLGGTALILVHKKPLMDQWVENIRKYYPNARVGIIQGDKMQYRDCDISVGMVQSLMSNPGKYPYDMFRYFRTVLIDEVHRFGSRKFSRVAPLFNAKYTIGESGTVRRKDHCERVFYWVIGDILAKASEINRIKPIIYVRETGYKCVKTKKFDMDDLPKPSLLSFISKSKPRAALVAQDVIKALEAGRQPLVMAERMDALERVSQAVYELGQTRLKRTVVNGFYIGGKKEKELAKAAASEVVYATLQIAQEGINIPRLDTLFLVTPISDPEQTIGRICRSLMGKKTPMVVDYCDSDLKLFWGIFCSRLKLYKRLGFQIIGMNV